VAATALPITNALGRVFATPLTALSQALVFTAADVANGNSFVSTGRELILVMNTGAAPGTVTVSSVVDPSARTGDITSYSLPIGNVTPQFADFGPLPLAGWAQPAGVVNLQGSAATVWFCIVRLPALS
jgi:hypothetical protein